jgi:signal transduction histidine kinase
VGFTVNLPWVHDHYFSELTRQVWDTSGGGEKGLTLSVTNGLRQEVVDSSVSSGEGLTNQRTFALIFFNPDAVLDPLDDLARNSWMVEVSAANDPALSQAISGANHTLMVGAAATLALAVGLVLTVRAQQASAKLVELRSDFVSTVTHELKTPIATIRAAAETLSHGRLNGIESFQAYGRLVVAEAIRLTRLVENLLAYSRITDIADTYAFEPLDVAMLFGDIQQEFQARLDESGFDLDMDIPPATPRIRGDRLALRLLFNNLIDNALRYSDKERRLRLRAHAERGAVTIEVIDWGIGIPSDEISLVTRKFVRGKRAPSGGSGLGLAIATRIANDHDGTLSIHSVPGEGTTVRVTLPTAQTG